MRRSRQPPQPQPLLSGRDIRRLITMICMLAVLWMMATRAADPKMWRFFASAPEDKPAAPPDTADNSAGQPLADAQNKDQQPDDKSSGDKTAGEKKPDAKPEDKSAVAVNSNSPAAAPANEFAWETVDPISGYEGPLDEDFEEREMAKEQFQAITDKQELAAVDMPTFWRFMRWSRTQTFDQMKKRAKRGGVDVLFTHFAQEPEEHRGELVLLKLHLKRVLRFKAPENSAGVKYTYDGVGVTDNDSISYPYVVVFSEKPPQLPLGADIDEEATFVGYYLKNMAYEAYNVRRFAPLLIGRIRWRANEARTMLAEQRQDSRLFWPVVGVGIVGLVALVGSWAWRVRHPKKRPNLSPESPEHQELEAWIDKAQQGELADAPENRDDRSDIGRRAVGNALDWIDPHRHNESS